MRKGSYTSLNGTRIFTQSSCYCCNTNGASIKLINDGAKYLVVNFIKTILINIKCFECKLAISVSICPEPFT